MHRVAGWQERHPRGAIRLGNFDTRIAAEAIEDRQVVAPIYISGVARSGTTMLLELLAGHTAVASHRYRDFPPVFTPWLWDRWLARAARDDEAAAERAHGDGIRVTSQSPEAFEEVLWMAFFSHLHDPRQTNRLGRDTENAPFAQFYDDHIRKLLAIRDGTRYVAKGNYNLMRLPYLQSLYADARFVLAVRDPVWHIASLIKQQRLFEAGEKAHPRALDHLRRVGHFEFGLDRRPINPGDEARVEQIEALWADGREIEGWSRYWALMYDALADELAGDAAVNEAALVVQYEALCADSASLLQRLYAHCDLAIDDARLAEQAASLNAPAYYEPAFTPEELGQIREITGPTAARFGYDPARLGEPDPLRAS
ncbi:sulfotransferase [Salinisphaera sp. Q1T1-3]|nr:sulfotransferase [Salinisphaera sp. Q1T1-3]